MDVRWTYSNMDRQRHTQQTASRHKCRRRMGWKEMKMVFYTRNDTIYFAQYKFLNMTWWRQFAFGYEEYRGLYSMNSQPVAINMGSQWIGPVVVTCCIILMGWRVWLCFYSVIRKPFIHTSVWVILVVIMPFNVLGKWLLCLYFGLLRNV